MKSMIRAGALAAALMTVSGAAAMAQPAQSPAGASPAGAPAADSAYRATTLSLSAYGETRIAPDMATITLGVTTDGPTAAGALQSNAAKMTQVIAALRRGGVAERDIQTSGLNINPQYVYVENQPPVVTGYQANNSVTVRFRDIAKSGAILDALVGAGANQINGPTLTIDKPESAQDEARTDAIKTARTRAELYARAAGLTVKRIVAISETSTMSGPQPMPYVRAQMADASAKSEVVPGEQDVGVTVSVTFELG